MLRILRYVTLMLLNLFITDNDEEISFNGNRLMMIYDYSCID